MLRAARRMHLGRQKEAMLLKAPRGVKDRNYPLLAKKTVKQKMKIYHYVPRRRARSRAEKGLRLPSAFQRDEAMGAKG